MKSFLQGTFWLSLSKVFNQIFSLVFFIILARLLAPSEFGKSALLFSYINISKSLFRGLEFNWIQHKDQKYNDLTAALFIGFIFSFAVGFIVFFIFNIFHEYQLLNFEVYDNYDFLILFSLISTSLLFILRGELSKRNEFKKLSFYNLISLVSGTSIAPILLVYFIYPTYKFLLLGLVLAQLIELLFLISYLKSSLSFKIPSIKKISEISRILFFDYKKLTVNASIGKLALNGDYLVIGSYMNSSALGIYNKAYELVSKPLNVLADSVQKVIISQGQIVDTKNKIITYLNSISILNCILLIPICIIINISSPLVFTFLLGENWSSIGDLISVMSWILFFSLNRKIANSIILLRREVSTLIKTNLIYAMMILMTTAFLVDYGLLAIGAGLTGVVFIVFLISWYYLIRFSKIKFYTVRKGFLLPIFIILSFLLIKFSFIYYYQYDPIFAGTLSAVMVYLTLILFELLSPKTFSIIRNLKKILC